MNALNFIGGILPLIAIPAIVYKSLSKEDNNGR